MYIYMCSGVKPPDNLSKKALTLNNIIRLLMATITLFVFVKIQVAI
jgi:hypothetical protein